MLGSEAGLERVFEEPLSINGLRDIAADYDSFIVDLWGVVHDGYKLFEDVIPCLEQLNEQAKQIIFLSNAPRSSGVIEEQLNSFGLPRHLYKGVVTSGDMTIDFLRRHEASAYYHIGIPEKDNSLLVGIGMNPSDKMHECDIIIASNYQDGKPLLENYLADFDLAIQREIPMVCANPDLLVYRGQEKAYCAGTLAEEYARRGGQVYFFGKPYPPIYSYLRSRYEANRWLAVGDALATDIRGANSVGINSLFVRSGIHQNESEYDFERAKPTYIINQLVW